MRVCLANPPWRSATEQGIRAGCRVPNSIAIGEHTFIPFPFTLAYAMARLENEPGVTAMIIDAIAEDLACDEFLQRVSAFQPDLVISEMATQSHHADLAIMAALKKRTQAAIVVCGPHPSALAQEILEQEQSVTFVMVGEYEDTVVELVRRLRQSETIEPMDGLAIRMAGRQIVVGPKRALIPKLDALPFPHRATLPLSKYCVAGFPSPVLFMYASRGCPYRCTFCVWPQWFKSGSYRTRSPESVVDEIEDAQHGWGPFRSIYFDDDTFNLGKQRMLQMAAEFKRRSMAIPWGCNARSDHFDEEVMEKLADAGLFNIRIGIESGDAEVLRRTKKDLDLRTVQPCIEMAHRAGVKVHVTFTIGLSGESWSSVKRTVAFARSITPDSAAFTITTPFPGTEYYDEVVRDGYLQTRDWEQYNVRSNSVVRTATMTPAEIVRAEKYVMRKVYHSPSYVLRRLRYVTGPRELFALAYKGARFLMGRF
jgi:radical SAM superfamily enzyme YgiQ (UPF0313 family)